MQENQLQINGIPETMLQTMYARSIESQKAKPLIYDKKAIEIVKKLDYDFSFAKKDKAMGNGVIARTIILDKLAGNFIARNPAACIVNIGCGLDTRYFRVDNGKIIWYDIDLPVTIDIRQRFISDNNRNKMIKGSILEENWISQINKDNHPVLIIMEGLSMYFTRMEINKILQLLSKHFPGSLLLMEIMNPFVVKYLKEKSIEKSNAKFKWGIKSGKEIESYNSHFNFIRDYSLVEGMKLIYPIYKVLGKIPVITNISNKIAMLKIRE